MASEIRTATAEAEIGGALEDWAKAVQAKDIAGIVAHYAPDIVAYDAVLALAFEGLEAYRAHWEACFTMCEGPMLFELHEPCIAADGKIAFCHCLVRCGGVGADGKEQTGWMRMTACYRRGNERWLIVHEHFSVPFDMTTGKALLELRPRQSVALGAA